MNEMPPSGVPAPERSAQEPEHWLVRKSTIRNLWIWSVVLLVLLTLLDLVIHKHGHFGIEDSFGFGSWYGFVSCVVLVFFSKALGKVLKRRDTYYHD